MFTVPDYLQAMNPIIGGHLPIAVLAMGPGVIRGKTIQNCTIRGPAVLALDDSSSVDDACTMDPGAFGTGAHFLKLYKTQKKVTGPIPVVGCTFSNCKFIGVGFTGSHGKLDEIMKAFSQ